MSATIEKKIVTKEEVMSRFGWSEKTLERRCTEGKVRKYYLGSSQPFFNLAEIENSFEPRTKGDGQD